MFTRISEVFNRKTAVIVSFIIFIAFSLACGWAKTMTQLIIFRTLQGAGGSGLYTLSMVILPEIAPIKLLPAISGIVGAVVAVAGVSGPIFGGLLASYSSWRWCFWMKYVSSRLILTKVLRADMPSVVQLELSQCFYFYSYGQRTIIARISHRGQNCSIWITLGRFCLL